MCGLKWESNIWRKRLERQFFDEIKTAGVGVGLGNVLYGLMDADGMEDSLYDTAFGKGRLQEDGLGRASWGRRSRGKTCPFGFALCFKSQNLVKNTYHTSTGLSWQESGFNLPTKKSGVQRVQTSPSFSPRKSAIKTEDLEKTPAGYGMVMDGMGQMPHS